MEKTNLTAITLKELKTMVGSTKGIKIPRKKDISKETGAKLIANRVFDDCVMEAYSNGFVVYQSLKRRVVLRIEDIGEATYPNPDGNREYNKPIHVSLEDMDWSIAVIICGDEQIERNIQLEKRRSKNGEQWKPSCNDGGHSGYDIDDLDGHNSELAADIDIEEQVITELALHQMLSTLTQRQHEVIELCVLLELREREAGQLLGISRSAVESAKNYGLRKLEKILKDFLYL